MRNIYLYSPKNEQVWVFVAQKRANISKACVYMPTYFCNSVSDFLPMFGIFFPGGAFLDLPDGNPLNNSWFHIFMV